MSTNLYKNYVLYFTLKFGDNVYDIPEPKNWDQVVNDMPRDKESYGFVSDFIDDEIPLVFPSDKGGELLRQHYESFVGNGDPVFFEFGYLKSTTKIALYQGQVSFNDYQRTVDGVSVSIEKMPFQASLKNRGDTPVAINRKYSFENEPLTPINTWPVRLHSSTIVKQTNSQTAGTPADPAPITFNSIDVANPIWLQPDTQSPGQYTEAEELLNMPPGILGASMGTPESLDLFEFQAKEAGWTFFNFSGTTEIWVFGPGKAWTFIIQPVVRVRRLIGTTPTMVDSSAGAITTFTKAATAVPAGSVPSDVFTDLSGSNAFKRDECSVCNYAWDAQLAPVNLQVDDVVFIGLKITVTSQISNNYYDDTTTYSTGNKVRHDFNNIFKSRLNSNTGNTPEIHLDYWSPSYGSANFAKMQLRNYKNSITIKQYTKAPVSIASGYRIFDFMQQVIECCTGGVARLKSDFFSEGGPGYNYLLTNGYAIRNFGGPNYSVHAAYNKLRNDLQAIFGLGIGYQRIDEVDYVIIEPISTFFGTKVLKVFPETHDWQDRHTAGVVYTNVTLGYDKYETNDIQMLEEFCTEGNYLLPNIKTFSSSFNKKSGIIASGTTLEKARRLQFAQNPTTSNATDDDIFIIALGNTFRDHKVNFLVTGGARFSMYNSDLQPGDKFTVSSGDNAGTVFTILSNFSVPGYNDLTYYRISPTPVHAVNVFTDVTIIPNNPNLLLAEKNGPFSAISGLLAPGCVYNARLSLKHLLYNWQPVIAVGLYGIDPAVYDSSQIVTTFVKNNNKLTTQFAEGEQFTGNAGNAVLVELDNVLVSEYNKNAIYTPKGAELKVQADYETVVEIKKSLMGQADDPDDNFGGIVATDDRGAQWFCHINGLKYNFKTSICTFDVQKVKQVYIGDGFE